MKKFVLIAGVLLSVSGCGGAMPIIYSVAPGHPIPDGLAVCTGNDGYGRCTNWSSNADTCVNPKGPSANPPLVPCPKDKDGKPIPFK